MAKKQKLNFNIPKAQNTNTVENTNTAENINTSEYSEVKPVVKEEPVKKNLAALSTIQPGALNTKNTAFNEKHISIDKIEYNPKNDYEIKESHINRLKESILSIGLQYNIVAVYDEDTDKYILNAGECRTRAIRELMDEYKEVDPTASYEENSNEYLYLKHVYPLKKHGVPCNVTTNNEIDAEIALIETNEIVRESDSSFKAKKVERLKELYTLKGMTEVQANKEIAEKMQLTERNVQRYNNVSKLIPELREAFDNNEISLSDGNSIGQLSEEEQLKILELLSSTEKTSKSELARAVALSKKRDDDNRILQEKLDIKLEEIAKLEANQRILEESIQDKVKEQSESALTAEKERSRTALDNERQKREEVTELLGKTDKIVQVKDAEIKKNEQLILEAQKQKEKIEKQKQALEKEVKELQDSQNKSVELSEDEKAKMRAEYETEILLKEAVQSLVKLNNKLSEFKKDHGSFLDNEEIKKEIANIKFAMDSVEFRGNLKY